MDAPLRSSRPTPGQRALAEALARGEAAAGEGMARLPAQLYLDEDRFAREQAGPFAHLPLLLGPSALLPKPNTAVTHDD